MIESATSSKRLTKQNALKLRGGLQFSSGQVFGRVVKAALPQEEPRPGAQKLFCTGLLATYANCAESTESQNGDRNQDPYRAAAG